MSCRRTEGTLRKHAMTAPTRIGGVAPWNAGVSYDDIGACSHATRNAIKTLDRFHGSTKYAILAFTSRRKRYN
jgi:hypothetical protein